VHHITKVSGGKGAARELVEIILKSKGTREEMIDKTHA
jgi:3-deoxy-D-manno-octulosonate 8-phosphate phosphatase KdsC-like HAD superfamily phosphatase